MKFTYYAAVVLWMAFIPIGAAAQSPISNRIRAAARHLPENARQVAVFDDNTRHCLYYTLNERLYKFDVWDNTNSEIPFDESYYKITNWYLSPNKNYIFLVTDNGSFTHFFLKDRITLWRLSVRGQVLKKVADGYRLDKRKGCFIISSMSRCLNPDAARSHQKWLLEDHYYDLTGHIIWASDEYLYGARRR